MEETGPRRSRPALGRRPLFFLIPVMSRSLYLAPSEESRPAHSLRPTWLQSVGPPSPLRPVCAQHHTSRPAKIPSPPGTPAHRHSLQTYLFPFIHSASHISSRRTWRCGEKHVHSSCYSRRNDQLARVPPISSEREAVTPTPPPPSHRKSLAWSTPLTSSRAVCRH